MFPGTLEALNSAAPALRLGTRCMLMHYSGLASIAQVAGAPGSLSMPYLPLVTDMMGTPGTLRMRLLRSRSLAKTGVRACRVQRGTVGLTGNDVDAMFLDAVDDALHLVSWKWGKGSRIQGSTDIIGICALVIACQACPPLVAGN